MTDETTTEPTEEPQQGVTLQQLWAINYETVLAYMAGNTLNKADRQQYRLKAAEVAATLTGLQVRQ